MRQRLDDRSDEGPREDDHSELVNGPPRRDAPPGFSDRLREWVEWFGLIRLVTSAIAVVIVCTGAWFLVRTPPPPSEDSLPMAVSASEPTSPSTTSVESAVGATTVASGPVVVHVAGAVAAPGVYELAPTSRVDDAVQRAGGVTADADPGQLNLATPLVDGDRVYVPEVGEVVPAPVGPVGTSAGSGPVGPVDVNRAGAAELDELPGIGPATAAAIVTDRDLNGPFSSVDDLERVPGIGPAKLAALAGLVTT